MQSILRRWLTSLPLLTLLVTLSTNLSVEVLLFSRFLIVHISCFKGKQGKIHSYLLIKQLLLLLSRQSRYLRVTVARRSNDLLIVQPVLISYKILVIGGGHKVSVDV